MIFAFICEGRLFEIVEYRLSNLKKTDVFVNNSKMHACLYVLWCCFMLFLSGCSSGYEVIMPFRNIMSSGESIFPVETNESGKTVRVWINNGTSIDRIITVYEDSVWGFEKSAHSNLKEIGVYYKKGNKHKNICNEREIVPESGIERFFEKADSLKLIEYLSQDEFYVTTDHSPFSLYVVEVKSGNKYNQFRFKTYFPYRKMDEKGLYIAVEKFLFEEFGKELYKRSIGIESNKKH